MSDGARPPDGPGHPAPLASPSAPDAAPAPPSPAPPSAPSAPSLRDADALARLAVPAGLCASCSHLSLAASARSVFVRCGLAAVDPRFLRYPALPVTACPGYQPAPPGATGSASSAGRSSAGGAGGGGDLGSPE